MNKFAIRLSTLALATLVAFPALAGSSRLPTADKSWKLISNEHNILTHSKDVPGSDVVAFRGETVIDGPIAKVANVLYDTSRKTEWVAKIVQAKNIRELSETDRIEYNHTASGFFFVKDRDFLFRATVDLNKTNKQLVIHMKSVTDSLMPETKHVRGELLNSSYILTSIDNGARTHMVVEIQADPKGNIPKWLVNLFQKSWPRVTLQNIQKQVAKPDVVELASVKKYFEEPRVTSTTALADEKLSGVQKASSVAKKTSIIK